MFTGIIEALGRIERIEREGSNVHFWVSAPFQSELRVDQSVAHNGVCLTVVDLKEGMHRVTAIDETVQKTSLGSWKEGSFVNLERCLLASGRFDGHIVQGHVDQTAQIVSIEEKDGSWNFRFSFDQPERALVVSKGSVTINGVSLTVVEASREFCSVSIIPFTYEHTTFMHLKVGDIVNIEFDILGKYVLEAQRRLLG
jgi:riboflavin synthase